MTEAKIIELSSTTIYTKHQIQHFIKQANCSPERAETFIRLSNEYGCLDLSEFLKLVNRITVKSKKELAKKYQAVRSAQNQYFKTKRKEALWYSKKLEKELDYETNTILNKTLF